MLLLTFLYWSAEYRREEDKLRESFRAASERVLHNVRDRMAGYELVRRLGWVRPLFGLKRTAVTSPARDGREREAVG